jgi:flagellar biosynthesis protein FlhF
MKIRRFYSKNMRTALRQVTDEFGEDAAILSSQKTPSGVEVIAALDYDEDLLPSSLAKVEESQGSNNESMLSSHSGERFEGSVERDNSSNNPSEFTEHRSADLQQSSNLSLVDQLCDDAGQQFNSANTVTSSRPQAKMNQLEWTTDPGLVAMREELGLMRTMMSEQLKGIGWDRFSDKDPITAMLTRRFTSLGIDHSIADRLIPRVKANQDAECSWQNLLALLAKSVNINGQDLLSNGGIYAFMGPTGAGKTTTIAKMAARFVIKHGTDSVALISTDNYRISAQQQLASFAKLLGIPAVSVTTSKPLDYLLNHLKHKKLILIDTAGMSSNDMAIAKQLETLKNTSKPIKRFLLMPATNQLAVLERSMLLFKPYSPYSVIITKLDEAASLGEILSLVIQENLPIAFTTDGQRIPEDLRIARNHHLVSKAVWLSNKYGRNPQDWQLAQEVSQVRYA